MESPHYILGVPGLLTENAGWSGSGKQRNERKKHSAVQHSLNRLW
jgi:hypothetical protein